MHSLKKRSEAQHELYFLLFEIGLAVSALFFITGKISQFRDNTVFDVNYLARDLALVLNTLSFSPGNAEYQYEYPKLSFDFDFRDKVTVKEKEGNPISYPYMKHKGLLYAFNPLSSPASITFYKSGKTISNQHLSLNRLPCTEAELGKIAIDFDLSQHAQELGLLAQSLSGKEMKKIYSDGKFVDVPAQMSAPLLALVSMKDSSFDYIKVYSSPEEKEKACTIANAVVDALGIPAAVIPGRQKGSMLIELGIAGKRNEIMASLAQALI